MTKGKGNSNASLHKIYLKKILNKDELKLFNEMYQEIVEHYALEGRPADQMLLSMACMDYIRSFRGLEFEATHPGADVSDALERAQRSMRANLSEMGITGKYKGADAAGTSFSAVLATLASMSNNNGS